VLIHAWLPKWPEAPPKRLCAVLIVATLFTVMARAKMLESVNVVEPFAPSKCNRSAVDGCA
jgi:hypothetical protein